MVLEEKVSGYQKGKLIVSEEKVGTMDLPRTFLPEAEKFLIQSKFAAQAAATVTEEIQPGEKAFHIAGNVFLGTRFGAADGALLGALGVTAVVNITAGNNRVPKYFPYHIQYLHLELADELATNPSVCVPQGVEALSAWGKEGHTVLVHCQAGLSRSVTVVLAWLMRDCGFSLKDASEMVSDKRGRSLRCAPSFWCYLAGLERQLRGFSDGTPPTFDFTSHVVKAFSHMSFTAEKIATSLQSDADWVNFELFYVALNGWDFHQLPAIQVVAQKCKAGQAMNAKMVKRGVATTMLLMEVYHCWPAFQVFGLESLAAFLAQGDDIAKAIMSKGGITTALHCMQEHSTEVKVQIAACRLLLGLLAALSALEPPSKSTAMAAGCHPFTTEFTKVEGPTVVASALQQHPTEVALRELAVSLLWGLACEHGSGSVPAQGVEPDLCHV